MAKLSRLQRLGKTACTCFDLFWQFRQGDITQSEMDKRLKDIESKQTDLFLKGGREK